MLVRSLNLHLSARVCVLAAPLQRYFRVGAARHSSVDDSPVLIKSEMLKELVSAELRLFAQAAQTECPLQPLPIRQIVRADSAAKHVAELVYKELPRRFAARIGHIEQIPVWADVPELEELHQMHCKSFQELRLADVENFEEFSLLISRILQRHKRIVPLFAEAVNKLDRDHADDTCTKVGIVDTCCDPWEICQQVVKSFQDSPCIFETENTCAGITFCHTPRYIFFLMQEVLMNSVRATVEASQGLREELEKRPIRVAMCADVRRVVFRISDRGGGVPDADDHNMSTRYLRHDQTSTPASAYPLGSALGGSNPLSGRGLGLPMARLYAHYLGGSLEVVNLPGLGVDAFLSLRRIELDQQ